MIDHPLPVHLTHSIQARRCEHACFTHPKSALHTRSVKVKLLLQTPDSESDRMGVGDWNWEGYCNKAPFWSPADQTLLERFGNERTDRHRSHAPARLGYTVMPPPCAAQLCSILVAEGRLTMSGGAIYLPLLPCLLACIGLRLPHICRVLFSSIRRTRIVKPACMVSFRAGQVLAMYCMPRKGWTISSCLCCVAAPWARG